MIAATFLFELKCVARLPGLAAFLATDAAVVLCCHRQPGGGKWQL